MGRKALRQVGDLILNPGIPDLWVFSYSKLQIVIWAQVSEWMSPHPLHGTIVHLRKAKESGTLIARLLNNQTLVHVRLSYSQQSYVADTEISDCYCTLERKKLVFIDLMRLYGIQVAGLEFACRSLDACSCMFFFLTLSFFQSAENCKNKNLQEFN